MAKLTDRYADELLVISEENGTLEKDLEQVILVRDTLNRVDVQSFLADRQVSDSAKRQFFYKVFSEKLPWHLMGFLYLMVRYHRESLIVPALTKYIDRIYKRSGKIEAKVVSARELNEKQIESIRSVLSKKIGMQVEVKVTVDPNLIAGFYILVDGRIFDATLRSELDTMRESLKRGIGNDS